MAEGELVTELVGEDLPVGAATPHVAGFHGLPAPAAGNEHPVHEPALARCELLLADGLPAPLLLFLEGDVGEHAEMDGDAVLPARVLDRELRVEISDALELDAEGGAVHADIGRHADDDILSARVQLSSFVELDVAGEALDLPPVEEAVVVGVAVEGVGLGVLLLGVGEAVVVGVAVGGLGAPGDAELEGGVGAGDL